MVELILAVWILVLICSVGYLGICACHDLDIEKEYWERKTREWQREREKVK